MTLELPPTSTIQIVIKKIINENDNENRNIMWDMNFKGGKYVFI